MEKHLNIISFDVPYPANYGGVIDIFNKIRSFNEAGVKIHLHCFEYGRGVAAELEKYCVEVFYYPRNISKKQLFVSKPFVVTSRKSEELLKNLLQNDYPILFEGLHCTYHLDSSSIKGRKRIVRTHNIEHEYYENLATVEKNFFKKYYFINEAKKLKRHESILKFADLIVAISKNDHSYFFSQFKHVIYIPAFHPGSDVMSKTGMGDYALYHANLEVGENNHAAIYLIRKVFDNLKYPLVIAGNKPSNELAQIIKKHPNITLKSNLADDDLYDLIANAHINILPTFQSTGLKLKLLASLFLGRWCITNSLMVKNTGLENLCIVKDTAQSLKEEIITLSRIPFSENEINKRKNLLMNGFDNKKNIERLIELIF